MRTIIELVERENNLPLLRCYVHNAPHRRAAEKHMKIIYQYREELVEAAMASNIALPINYALEVEVLFVSPSSPDLDNLVMCFMRAMDGSSHSKITVLKDDGLIQSIKASKFFPR